MQLIIMRHGDAVSAAQGGDRVLSAQGESEVAQCAAKLHAHVHINRILASPKTRAQQTAAIVNQGLGLEIMTMEELAPRGDGAAAIAAVLHDAAEDDCILLVSHIPTVEFLVIALDPHLIMPHFGTACALVVCRVKTRWLEGAYFSPQKEQLLRPL